MTTSDRACDPGRPLVSVGFPVRNGVPLVERALRAIREQTYSNLEIVVSDNGSTDGTSELLARHAAEDARIRLERVEPYVSSVENFDLVLQRAGGDFFMWAAHDDEFARDHVERLVPFLRDDDSVAMATAVAQAVDLDGNVLRTWDRVVELQLDDPIDRLVAFIEQPEPEGKANLMYSLFRRADLAKMNLAAFLAEDTRRLDYHIVLAMLVVGCLRVDPGLRFRKTIMPIPHRSMVRRVVDGVRYTKQAAQWTTSYPRVIEERMALTPAQRTRIERAARASHRRYYVRRARSVAGTLIAGVRRR